MKQSFQHAKSALCDATMLAHPITNAPIAITTDASDIDLGATLEQYVNNNYVMQNESTAHMTENYWLYI